MRRAVKKRSPQKTIRVRVHKADGFTGQPSPSLRIEASTPTPGLDGMNAETIRNLYRGEAKQLAAALRATLPGGTFQALIVELMETQLGILKVSL